MKQLLACIAMLCTIGLFAQDIKPATLVAQATKNQAFKEVSLLDKSQDRSANIPKDISEYTLYDLNSVSINQLLRSNDSALKLSLTDGSKRSFDLAVVEVQLPPFEVRTAPANELVKYQGGKHYRGIVEGDDQSIVALSVFEDQVMALISESRTDGNWVLGKVKGSDKHIFYNDPQIAEKFELGCETPDTHETYSKSELSDGIHHRALSDCVGFYFEVDYDIYQDKGSNTTTTTNYITGLYNQVAIMYANENINTNISEIIIWTQTSPYNGSNSSQMLNQFTAYRNGFNGDLAMLLSYQASGGIAYVNTLCNTNPDVRMSFSSIYSSYANVPNYSWSVMVVTHEFGHLFGSQHTHACVWNGNGTAIDGCYQTEGSCPSPGIPSNGGTVMSYCHLTNVGINLNNGFGPQPGNLIRSRVTNASCLQPCSGGPTCNDGIQNGNETGVDCGGPDCAPCQAPCNDTEVTVTIVLDNYPGETTWTLKDANGVTLASGGPYNTAGATVSVTECLPDGCYDFSIFDSYGDGICCAYGQGSYEVASGNTIYASGGQFGSSEITNFCVGNSNNPTCTDGIQNGNETGIDCGGPDCPACPTCNDGVQNGNETGVDCGGPDCPACPTCNDGVQNGSETGVDCGGPDCAPCTTCNDGVQNGNETGIDCGGPDCPACPTCTDGIQNGNETGVDCGGPDCPACPTCNDGVQNGSETGVDCGGPDCAPCNSGCNGTEVTITLVLDNYPGETTWNLKDANGNTIVSGGPYNTAGATITVVECLTNGCYDFTINDSYGDGICCAYGQGSYEVASGNTIYASGGQFGSTETTNFCLGGNGPTCNDGVQNGNETGVDCGGPDCAPCATCNDGIQNGNETGVDCGGPDCAPCGNGGSTVIDAFYFESGWDGWIDGGSDCFRLNNSSVAYEGNFSIRLRDNSGTASSMTSSAYDFAPYNTVELEFFFYPNSMENGENFFVQYNNGSGWTTVANFVSGVDFSNGTFYQVTLNLDDNTYNFSGNSRIRIQCDASTNSDQVYIDAVTFTGINGSTLLESLNNITQAKEGGHTVSNDALQVSPNPTSDILRLSIYDEEEVIGDVRTITVFDMMGRLVQAYEAKDLQEDLTLDVSQLNDGVYILRVNTDDEEILSTRFVVSRR